MVLIIPWSGARIPPGPPIQPTSPGLKSWPSRAVLLFAGALPIFLEQHNQTLSVSSFASATLEHALHEANVVKLQCMRRGGLLMVLALVSGLSSAAQKGTNESPLFASQAAPVFPGGSATSPDGRNVVSVRLLDDNAHDFPSQVRVSTPSGTLTSKIPFGLNAEVLWSDDSRAFAVTGSQEGGNGQYHSAAFYIRAGRLVREPLTSLIERAFGHPVKCGWAESPNVVAVKWLDGSKRLLVAAQIINHSNCDSSVRSKDLL